MTESGLKTGNGFMVGGTSVRFPSFFVPFAISVIGTLPWTASAEPAPPQRDAPPGTLLPTVYFVEAPYAHAENGSQTVPVKLIGMFGEPMHVDHSTSDTTATVMSILLTGLGFRRHSRGHRNWFRTGTTISYTISGVRATNRMPHARE